MSHLEFLRALISEQADQRRERGIAYRLRHARFAESKTLADFDWLFNAGAIDRLQIEALARRSSSAASRIWSWWGKAAWARVT